MIKKKQKGKRSSTRGDNEKNRRPTRGRNLFSFSFFLFSPHISSGRPFDWWDARKMAYKKKKKQKIILDPESFRLGIPSELLLPPLLSLLLPTSEWLGIKQLTNVPRRRVFGSDSIFAALGPGSVRRARAPATWVMGDGWYCYQTRVGY